VKTELKQYNAFDPKAITAVSYQTRVCDGKVFVTRRLMKQRMSFDLLAFKAACGRFALIYLHELLELVAQREEQSWLPRRTPSKFTETDAPVSF
jgi:hypothetical protein